MSDVTNDLQSDLEVIDATPDADDGVEVSADLDGTDGPNGDRLVVRRRRARRNGRLLALEWGLVSLSPAFLYFIVRPEPFFIGNGVDPFLYLGYAWDPGDLIHRFGMEYYAVRFGLTLPIDLFTRVFGVVGGYFALRYALVLIAIVPLYAYLRHKSRAMGALGIVLFLTSPMLLRGLMSSYSDTTGIPYLTGAICLLLLTQVDSRWRRTRMLGAGLLLGLAIHSNPIIVALGLAIVGGWGLWEIRSRRWRLALDGLLIVAGIAAVTLVGVAYYWYRFNDADLISPSIDATIHWSGQAGDSFRAPDYSWLGLRFFLFLPPLIVVCWLASWRRRDRPSRDAWAAMTILAAMTLFFVIHEFVLASSSLETYYYTSYLTPAIVVGLVTVVHRWIGEWTPRWQWATPALVLGALFVWFAIGPLEFSWNPGLLIVVGVTLAAALLARFVPRTAIGAVSVLLIANLVMLLCAPANAPLSRGQTFRYDPHYELALDNPGSRGLSWYEMSHQLVDIAPPLAGKAGNLLFWYDTSNQILASLQSTYRSLPIAWQANLDPMPSINDAQMERLRDEHVGWLVLMGTSIDEIRAGTDALRARGVRIRSEKVVALHAPGYRLTVAVVRIKPPPMAPS